LYSGSGLSQRFRVQEYYRGTGVHVYRRCSGVHWLQRHFNIQGYRSSTGKKGNMSITVVQEVLWGTGLHE